LVNILLGNQRFNRLEEPTEKIKGPYILGQFPLRYVKESKEKHVCLRKVFTGPLVDEAVWAHQEVFVIRLMSPST